MAACLGEALTSTSDPSRVGVAATFRVASLRLPPSPSIEQAPARTMSPPQWPIPPFPDSFFLQRSTHLPPPAQCSRDTIRVMQPLSGSDSPRYGPCTRIVPLGRTSLPRPVLVPAQHLVASTRSMPLNKSACSITPAEQAVFVRPQDIPSRGSTREEGDVSRDGWTSGEPCRPTPARSKSAFLI